MKEVTADDLYNELPPIFFPALLGEIVSMYGEPFFGDIGSLAWYSAFKAACKKINAKWIYKKYRRMPWDVGDEFAWMVSNKIQSLTPAERQAYQNFIK